MKICITGGSGFIGTKLATACVSSGHTVVSIDRTVPAFVPVGVTCIQADLTVDPVPKEALDCDAVVHLAGASIFGRWTAEYKKIIFESRIRSAEALIAAYEKAPRKPSVFVSASAVGYYGDGGEKELPETAEAGSDFLSSVCVAWEKAAYAAENLGARVVTIRTGIVLGKNGGMLSKLVPIFRYGLGGVMASGSQWFSWIHLDDLIAVYLAPITDSRLSGPINAVAPEPVRNRDFTRALGAALHRPAFFAIPYFALKIILGELAGAVTASARVIPTKLTAAGFLYRYRTIDQALGTIE